MLSFTDQMDREVRLHQLPRRIISLVPSQTELLHSLGLEEEVVGITKFCLHPAEWFHNKPRVGGTKVLKPEKIAALQPDLIIGNKEENQKEQIEALMQDYPVWMSDISTLEDAYQMIAGVGELTGKADEALLLSQRIRDGFTRLQPASTPLRVAYLIWKNPYMAAGGGTFIDDMLQRCGMTNVFADRARYPEITEQDLTASEADYILLSSEPFPFKQKHVDELERELPGTKAICVDGEMYSWYGSRLLHSPAYFNEVLAQL